MSVNEYITMFTQLSRYAPHEVDTDEKIGVKIASGPEQKEKYNNKIKGY